jgi:hypothetical protein
MVRFHLNKIFVGPFVIHMLLLHRFDHCGADMYISILLNKKFWEEVIAFFPSYNTDHIENSLSNNPYIAECIFVVAATIGVHIHTN